MTAFGRRAPIFALTLLIVTGSANANEMGGALFENDCAACHTLKADAPAKRGPHLEGLFDRRYGAVEGFPYRMVWKKADPVWTDKEIDNYLFIHGRYEAPDRATLIEYLKKATRP